MEPSKEDIALYEQWRNECKHQQMDAALAASGVHGALLPDVYGITVKHTGINNYIHEDQLKAVVRQMYLNTKRYELGEIDGTYELDSKQRLHYHGFAFGKPNAWIKPMAGYHIHLCPLADKQDAINWFRYIHKDVKNDDDQMEIFWLNECRNQNVFQKSAYKQVIQV